MNFFEYILEKKIFYLIIGFIFSIASVGRFNFPLFIFIWPYCFLVYLHQNEKKLIPLIIVSFCLIVANLIRWTGYNRDGILPDMAFGLHYSIINIIPYIIDDLIYNNIAKWASIFVFPLLVSFTEYLFEFSWFANHNVFAYALRNNIHIIQICSLFGCYFLSFIIALFATIVDYSHDLYKKEKKISKFVTYYAIIILLITSFGTIRLLIPEKAERYNVAAALGITPCLYEEGKYPGLPIDDYMNYIEKTIIKANKSEAKVIVYSEEAFGLYEVDRKDIIDRTAKLAEKYNIFVVLPLDVVYGNYNKNEAILISNKGKVLYNYEKNHLIPLIESKYRSNMTDFKTFKTDFGYFGVVICYDSDFAMYINHLSRLGLDTLLLPSWDWDSITDFHSLGNRFRSIENGFNTIKSAANGIALSYDYKGRILSYFQPSKCEDYFILSTLYKRGTWTLYSKIGKFFNYIYLIALIILVIIGRLTMNKENIMKIEKLKLKKI